MFKKIKIKRKEKKKKNEEGSIMPRKKENKNERNNQNVKGGVVQLFDCNYYLLSIFFINWGDNILVRLERNHPDPTNFPS